MILLLWKYFFKLISPNKVIIQLWTTDVHFQFYFILFLYIKPVWVGGVLPSLYII